MVEEISISFKIDRDVKEKLQKLADSESRTLANYCRLLITDHVKEKAK